MPTYYAAVGDLYKEMPKVSTTGLTDGEYLVFLERAGSIIDAFLAHRYILPFAAFDASPPTPGIIKTVCVDLALMDLFDRMPGETPAWIIRRTERAYEILKMLADLTIDVPGATEIAEQDVVRSTTSQYVPTFGSKGSITERVDPFRAQNERDARDAEDV